ncbi:MAG: hypothetical protein V3R52_06395 [Candidatus Neomarinimicrobiota bacterium]
MSLLTYFDNTHSAVFWDELAWEKLLTKWRANKFIIQTGFHWVFKTNPAIADLCAEVTISRPWTYTHNEIVNSYTSEGIRPGLPQGPNSQPLLLWAGFWPFYQCILIFHQC